MFLRRVIKILIIRIVAVGFVWFVASLFISSHDSKMLLGIAPILILVSAMVELIKDKQKLKEEGNESVEVIVRGRSKYLDNHKRE